MRSALPIRETIRGAACQPCFAAGRLCLIFDPSAGNVFPREGLHVRIRDVGRGLFEQLHRLRVRVGPLFRVGLVERARA